MAKGVSALLSVCVGVCVASNLDTSFPLLKTGGRGSLFGLSVALHQDLKRDEFLLLVGAPREKAEPNIPANRTGGVYSCPLTGDRSDCTRMLLIDSDLKPSEDMVEDMWLGVSVVSQGRPGGRVLACGHRFIKLYGAFNLRHMIGRCYLRGTDLQYDDTDMHWQNPDQVCSHLAESSNEVMCNMGISAAITQTEVIVGSPGSYDWQGNVHVSWMNPDVQFDTHRSSFSNLQQRNIYIGYSVTQARGLLSQDNETIVTGAPKDTKEDVHGSVLLAAKESETLVVQQTLRGEQMGSYFGNAVATADFDSDGWNDLLVGAPFYFHRQQELGGAVYVYMNAGGRFEAQPSVVLRGPAGSAFGMAVAAAGDLNRDGFQDFAVGAPFHETGSVMIWTGSRTGISAEPSQVIYGSQISPGFKTFGYSLSGNLDVDGNHYPDLLVGSLDDTVALLRSRPVIHLNKTLRVSPERVDPHSCNYCIEVHVCFFYTFSTGEMSDKDNITVHFTVTADVRSSKPRLHFLENGQNVYSDYLSMPRDRCKTLTVGLRKKIQDKVEPLVFSLNASLYEKRPKKRHAVQDLKHFPVLSQTPAPLRTEIHIQKNCSDNLCHSNLQMTARFTDENQKPFAMQDGQQVMHYNASITRLILEVNVTNMPSPSQPAEDAYSAVLNVSIPPSLIYFGVRTTLRTSVEGNVLQFKLGNPFKSRQKVQVLIIFQPSENSLDTREIKSKLQLFTLSKQSDLSPAFVSMLMEYSLETALTPVSAPGPTPFSGHVIGESAMKKTEDIGSLLLFTFKVHMSGRPLGDLGNLEVEFEWPWELSNGKWLLYLTEIQVNGTSEPLCLPPGNIINPLRLQVSNEEKRRRRSLEEAEEEENKEAERQGERVKTLPALHLQGQKKKSYTLDCVQGAKCVTFTCPLLNMNNTATLTVRARLWNSTMLEEYTEARSVFIRGRATLRLRTDKPTINMESQSTEIEVYVYPDLRQQVDSSIPLWIIVVSVLAGVLLLSLICLLLWKCGFFVQRRAWRATELHQGTIVGKERQQQYTDEDGFLIREDLSSKSGKNRKKPKQWVTWTETH